MLTAVVQAGCSKLVYKVNRQHVQASRRATRLIKTNKEHSSPCRKQQADEGSLAWHLAPSQTSWATASQKHSYRLLRHSFLVLDS